MNIYSNLPKISVVTPSFNQGKYIRETIESVFSQKYPNFEYIIIDGGSSDSTLDIIAEYKSQLSYFVSESDKGQSHALNKGFEHASGDIYCWLNSDDQFSENALWSAAMAFHTTKADMIAGICEVFENGELIHRHMSSCSNGLLPLNEILDLDNGWNAGQFFYQPEVFFTRALWDKSGGYVREDCYYSMDYELWCRFAYAKARIHIIGTPLVNFRTHPDQKTSNPNEFKRELIKVRNQFCQEHDIKWLSSNRPEVNWSHKLKIALVNDLGYLYGAGIAHMRIAAAFEHAGHEIAVFELLSTSEQSNYSELIKQVEDYDPHFIIWGNLHAVNTVSIDILSSLEALFPCFWLTHDFWLLTGRCAYVSSCSKHLTGCDNSCPTSEEYPALEKGKINEAWKNKRKFLSNTKQFDFLANSQWANNQVDISLKTFDNNISVKNISLGVPTEMFKVGNQKLAQRKLSIKEGQFVIAFSVSSLSCERKGGKILINTLNKLIANNITLILIGRIDQPIELPNINLIKLGYVKDVKTLVLALNAADIYVGPSTEETFGQVFVEAALCGTPSIGFDVTGVKDAIYDGITGFKVKEISELGLSKAIMRFYDNSQLLLAMAKLAPIYAKNQFSLEASYHSFFTMLNSKGLIDKWKLPHKISFSSTSEIIAYSSKGWSDLPIHRKVNVKLRAFVNRIIGLLPSRFTAKIAQVLPNKIEKTIINWLFGRN